jgi:small Trp-rich protein
MKSQGIGFAGVLALIFIGLKLAEVGVVASWSWWWVLAPLWVPSAILLTLAGVFGLIYIAASVWEKR